MALSSRVGRSRNRRADLHNSFDGECDTGDWKLYAGVGDVSSCKARRRGGDYIELAWDEEHYTYQLYGVDTLESAAAALANSINTFSQTMQASASGAAITLTLANSSTGTNGNRIGVYGNVYSAPPGTPTESWQPVSQLLSGGVSPSQWQINLDFSSISGLDPSGATVPVPMNAVRKMRWTWAADLQPGNFARSEFEVVVSNWTVSGSNRDYQVAGPGSWRVEDDDVVHRLYRPVDYGDRQLLGWIDQLCDRIRARASVTPTNRRRDHILNLGTRRIPTAAQLSVQVDQNPVQVLSVALAGEDVLVRWDLGDMAGGTPHTVTITHTGVAGFQLSISISWKLRFRPAIFLPLRRTRKRRWRPTGTRCTRRLWRRSGPRG